MIPFPPYTRPEPTVLDVIANVLLVGAGLGSLLFVLAYAIVFRWYETAAGRAVLGFVASLVLVLLLNVIARASGGDYPGRDVLRVFAYGAVFVGSWGLVVELVRSWRRGGPALDLRERESMKRTPTDPVPIPIDLDD